MLIAIAPALAIYFPVSPDPRSRDARAHARQTHGGRAHRHAHRRHSRSRRAAPPQCLSPRRQPAHVLSGRARLRRRSPRSTCASAIWPRARCWCSIGPESDTVVRRASSGGARRCAQPPTSSQELLDRWPSARAMHPRRHRALAACARRACVDADAEIAGEERAQLRAASRAAARHGATGMSAETGLQAWLAARVETWRRLTPTLDQPRAQAQSHRRRRSASRSSCIARSVATCRPRARSCPAAA